MRSASPRFRMLALAIALGGAPALTPVGYAQIVLAQNAPTATAAPMAEGEIRKVDKAAGKLTIKHGEIKNLDMPPMTMVFLVRDKAMLDQVKLGDKVSFSVIEEKGKMVVTEIKPKM